MWKFAGNYEKSPIPYKITRYRLISHNMSEESKFVEVGIILNITLTEGQHEHKDLHCSFV